MAYELTPLPYPTNALEPHIDTRTMEIHHDKHHAAYVAKCNAAIEGSVDLESRDIEDLIANLKSVPESIRGAVRNNGGGILNHNIFWTIMGPDCGGDPDGEVADGINGAFGNFDSFKKAFGNAATNRFGSGWAWLVKKRDGSVDVYSTANQDSPLMQGDLPLLGLDVWEHAYYLNYQNRRPDYIAAFFNVINWDEVGRRFGEAQ